MLGVDGWKVCSMTSSEFSNEDMKNTFLKKKKSDLVTVIANYSKYLNM